ncbi:immunoglobulin superfamily DCC subclass member 3-like [Mauremys reevesii]|uniref:immunoglobulin superfamily DCC subclass member 3-like n=1 Tax=Mauremys reevesii TaxID=260615 RepID=UPI00193F9403|nr:immunoglobulin superfamily DCC subclass member 3-like [Mauremys reevesii]
MARWRLCLAGLLLLQGCGLGCPSELAFRLEPADVIAVRERPLVLHCWVEGEPPITITWHKDGAVLANGSLRIESFCRRPGASAANPPSVGEYSCAAQNRHGLLVSRKARVQLATLSTFHMHPASMAVEEGGVARSRGHHHLGAEPHGPAGWRPPPPASAPTSPLAPPTAQSAPQGAACCPPARAGRGAVGPGQQLGVQLREPERRAWASLLTVLKLKIKWRPKPGSTWCPWG